MFSIIKSLALAPVNVLVEWLLPDCLQGVGGGDELFSVLSPLAPLAILFGAGSKPARKSRRKAGRRR